MEKWQDPETLALWFGIVIFFVLVLVISIVVLVRLNYRKILSRKEAEAKLIIQHKHEMLSVSIEVQEKERDRIASDLHDSLIGKLTALRLTHQINTNLTDIDKMIDDSIITARRISHDLSPPLIEITDIEDIIEEIYSPWKIKFDIRFSAVNNQDGLELTSLTKIQLSRIIREVLTNINKHANASEIEIILRHTKNIFSLIIRDNGVGINLDNKKKGLGLKSIESRVEYIKGKFRFKSKKNKMTSFLVVIVKNEGNKNI